MNTLEDAVVEYCRGSTPCGPITLKDDVGEDMPFVALITAPESAWIDGETAPWETWIFFGDTAGAKSAYRLARWLRRGDVGASVRIDGRIGIFGGREHMGHDGLRRISQVAPSLIDPMPERGVATVSWEGGAA